jgi:hypothetical protein
MNNEFAWRKQIRELDRAVAPTRDLWPQIHARIAAAETRRGRWPRIGLAIAAAVLIACAIGLSVPRMHSATAPLAQVAPSMRSAPVAAVGDTTSVRTALDWAVPANPTLATAAHDLDSASADLQQALEQRPDAVFLVGLLNRTNGQRMRLLREPYAG